MDQPHEPRRRPVALITGVGRRAGIAAGIAERLADDGWDLALSYWPPYDADQAWASADDEPERIAGDLRGRGARIVLLPGDLAEPSEPDRVVAEAIWWVEHGEGAPEYGDCEPLPLNRPAGQGSLQE